MVSKLHKVFFLISIIKNFLHAERSSLKQKNDFIFYIKNIYGG
jgi:hypothetical protein